MVSCARNYKILASVSENLSPALGSVNPTQHSNIVRYILSGNSQQHLRYRGYHTVPEISTSITICPLAGYTKQQSCSKLNQGNNAPRTTSYSAQCAPPLSYAAIYLPFVPVRHEYGRVIIRLVCIILPRFFGQGCSREFQWGAVSNRLQS